MTAVGLVLAGAVVGAVATDRWRAQRADDATQSATAVVLLPDLLPRPLDGTQPTSASGRLEAQLTGHVDVVNAGPAPLVFAAFQVSTATLKLNGAAPVGNRPIPPGDYTVGTLTGTMPATTTHNP